MIRNILLSVLSIALFASPAGGAQVQTVLDRLQALGPHGIAR
jgi:hypothetical protein